MEPRKITIIQTKEQRKSVIVTAATTLAELKSDLRTYGINYNDMTFYEGTSKIELKNDASILPHDVPYKGTITNELVFMLTNTNKKIRSGVTAMSRTEAYSTACPCRSARRRRSSFQTAHGGSAASGAPECRTGPACSGGAAPSAAPGEAAPSQCW